MVLLILNSKLPIGVILHAIHTTNLLILETLQRAILSLGHDTRSSGVESLSAPSQPERDTEIIHQPFVQDRSSAINFMGFLHKNER
jgi:hypothetical protein